MDLDFKKQLIIIFKNLNRFIEQKNKIIQREGGVSIPKQKIYIVGQTALLLANLPCTITATMDLDIISSLPHLVFKKLCDLLLEHGLHLETDGHLIWIKK